MNITKNDVDALNSVITLKIEESDYESRVNDLLKDYRRKANIPGFRPGKVPMGMIKKTYGKAVLADELNKIVSDSLFGYFRENDLKILGEPLPNEDDKSPIDFDTDKEFEFSFDIAVAPEVELNVDENIKLPYYTIEVDEAKVDEQIDKILTQMGTQEDVEIVEQDDLVRGTMEQLDAEGKVIEDGHNKEEALLAVNMIKDEEIKAKFIGANVNQIISFNPMKAYNNATEVATMLEVDKENETLLNADYQLSITEIKRHKKAELDQKLFDTIYGEGNVTTEEEFRQKIRQQFSDAYERDSDYKLTLDARDKFVEELNPDLPEKFLKRWLVQSNQNQEAEEKLTPEKVEEDFPHFEKDLKWQLIRDHIVETNELSVSEQDIIDYAKEMTIMQFQQYGLSPEMLGEDGLTTYAMKILENPQEKNKIREHKLETKVMDLLKEKTTLEKQTIKYEDFKALVEGK